MKKFILLCTVYFANTMVLKRCEPNRAKLCKSKYNETRFPNYLRHRSQEDAISDLNQYAKLVDIGCAKHLDLFLCSLFVPMCTVLDRHLLPCRSLCEEAKAGCEQILMRFAHLPWPQQLRCEQFPERSPKTLCIGYEKKIKQHIKRVTVTPNKRTKITENDRVVLQCQKSETILFRKIIHDKSNCKRIASQEALKKLCNNHKKCEFQLSDVTDKYGQPASCKAGHVGRAIIKYQCAVNEERSHAKQITLRYDEDKNLVCKSKSRHLLILKVQFKDDRCITPNAFCSVSQACTGKQTCALWANEHYISSTCGGKKTKLIVDYECAKKSENVEKVVEAYLDKIMLKCPARKTISIVRAEYIGQLCQSKEIYCAVNLRCEDQKSCLLNKKNLSAVKCNEGRVKVRIRYICS